MEFALIKSQPAGLRTTTTERYLQTQDKDQMVRRIVKAIEDGLSETLGEDLAAAVRTCLRTTFALSEPTAYALALDLVVGSENADRALRLMTKRLRELEDELKPTSWNEFSESIVVLRGRYSTETTRNTK